MNIFLLFAGGGMSLITPSFGLFFWTAIIFLTFWFLMSRFAFKPIAAALKERQDSINESLAAAERAKEEMAALQSENERIILEAREEKANILREAKEIGENFIAESKEKAKTEAKKIVDGATAEILVQKTAALSEVKNQVGLIAVSMAEKVLGKELRDKNDQQKYVSELIEQINLN